MLNGYFVPIYISHEAYDRGDAPEAEKKEWRRIYFDAVTKLKRSGTVHVYILTPADGELIESIDIGTAMATDKLLARLQAVVAKLKTPRGTPVVKPAPQSCAPRCEPGSLVLHLAARAHQGLWNEFPVENWIVLTPAERAKLLPADGIVRGKTWDLDRNVAAKFLTHFVPSGYGYAYYQKVDIQQLSLTAQVTSIENGVTRARLDGRLKLKHKSLNFEKSPPADVYELLEMPLAGYLEFDRDSKQIHALRLLAERATARRGAVEYSVGLRSMP